MPGLPGFIEDTVKSQEVHVVRRKKNKEGDGPQNSQSNLQCRGGEKDRERVLQASLKWSLPREEGRIFHLLATNFQTGAFKVVLKKDEIERL